MAVLSIPSFGGGIALLGSADAQRTDEVQAADSYDIGVRGQLVAASDLSAFVNATTGALAVLAGVYALTVVQVPQGSFLLVVGDSGGTVQVVKMTPDGSAPISSTPTVGAAAAGFIITFAQLPYVGTDGKQKRVVLINIGARAGQDPDFAPGLYVMIYDPATTGYTLELIENYDVLGTGIHGEFPAGTHGHQLQPRGVIIYNNHAFVWGYDNHDSPVAGGHFDGPNRMMFSNQGNPLKYGLDPDAAGIAAGTTVESDRAFTDSDAFTIGGAGENIRAGCVWAGKLWVGTDAGMHYIEGFGRESFLTNGALPVTGSENVIGPYCMVEGPDRLLHIVSQNGHCIFDGANVDPVYLKLHDFKGKSPGYWDMIWSDPAAMDGVPGKTNQDLVWMLSMPDMGQVWIVIPYCSIAHGYGVGGDTIILKYHVHTGGYTRQRFPGVILRAGELYKRDHGGLVRTYIPAPGSNPNLQLYGFRASSAVGPTMVSGVGRLPDTTLGEYAPYGVDGIGVNRKFYLVIGWEAGALPLTFVITPTIDGKDTSPVTLTIGTVQPVVHANGDLWVDTSGTDTSIGNVTGDAIIPASANDYLLWRWHATWAKWVHVPGMGQQGTRITVPIAHDAEKGTRVKYRVQCTTATGRYQLESAGFGPPVLIRSDA